MLRFIRDLIKLLLLIYGGLLVCALIVIAVTAIYRTFR